MFGLRHPFHSESRHPLRWAAGAVCLWFCMAGCAQAQAQIKTLTLDEALRIAGEKNKDVLKAREFRKYVQGKYVEERAGALPNLTVTSGVSRAGDKSQKAMFGVEFDFPTTQSLFSAEVGFTQALYTWGQVGAAIRAAKEGIQDADAQLMVFRQAVARDVAVAFTDILLAKELHLLAIENLNQKTRHQEDAKKRYEMGVATDYDVLAADVDVQNARPEVIRTRNFIRTTKDNLMFILGMENRDADIDVVGGLEAPVAAPPDFGPTLQEALANRPDVKEIGHRIAIAGDLVTIYNAGDKPRLDLRGGAGWRNLWVADLRGSGTAYSVGVYLTFPAYDGGRTRGKVIQARSDRDSLLIDKAKLEDSIGLQVRGALNTLTEAAAIVEAVMGNVSQADRLLKMAENGFELGVKTRLDVSDAEHNVMSAKVSLSKAKRDIAVARVHLEWVTARIRPVGPDGGASEPGAAGAKK